ncbi:MAG: hypothetical protein GEU92_19245 [Alphaproteobacteria bacterium]|nr:hypothetical protein [Alphaproteobacteria bacterium]
MATATSRPRLRNALKKLRAVEPRLAPGYGATELAQEMLDFLAMADGMKPACLIGRGFDDPEWIAGAVAVASGMKLRVIEGPFWDAAGAYDGLPGWYAEFVQADLAPFRAWYVTRTAAVAARIEAACASGRPTAAEEAALLGYPACCVAAHHGRNRAFHEATLSILARRAAGDEAEMARMLREGEPLIPETDAEKAAFLEGMRVTPCPCASVNMCEDCRTDSGSPAARLSARYAAFAREIDPVLAQAVGAG